MGVESHRWRCIILLLTVGTCAFPQGKVKRLYGRVDSLLRTRYERVTYDTQYISRPDRRLLLRVRANLSGNSIRYKNEQGGNNIHAHVSTALRGTVSLGASYMGISAAFSLNPGKMSGRNKDFEFNASAASNRYIIDLNYQRSNTLSGDIDTGPNSYYLDKDFAEMKILSVSACYFFNRKRRFSYPAAFSQSYIQKRSAGSWLAGVSFVGGTINTNDDVPGGFPRLNLKVRNVAVGGGYAHNFVYRKCLFHLSLVPTVIVYNYNKITLNNLKRVEYTHFPDFIVNARAAVLYNISPRYFVGSTVVANSSVLGNFDHYTSQTKWLARAFFGFRI